MRLLARAKSLQGMSLGSTLLVLSIIALLIFTLASSSVAHLHLMSHRSQAQVAENASRSVVEVALAQILEEPEFGISQESVTLPGEGDGQLSFEARANPRSTNNLEGEGSVEGWQSRVVPPQSVLLVGRSKFGNVTRTTEALYVIPSFPYAISGTAPVKSEGALIVGGVESLDAAYESMEKEDLLPADLASNADSTIAIQLGPEAFIAGDVSAVGGVAADQADIRGEVHGQGSEVTLPKISLDRYDPQSESGVLEFDGSDIPRSIGGLARYDGDMAVTGPLELDNGVLYVDGDFTLRKDYTLGGGLQGYGALIVRGKTTIEGGSKLAHLNGVALLSQGDVEIVGDSLESSFFQGLLYTEGSIRAENLTVLGGLVCNSSRADARVFLKDCRAIHVPELTQIDVGNPPVWKFESYRAPEDSSGTPDGTVGATNSDPRILSMSSDFRVYYDSQKERIRLVSVGKADIGVEAKLVQVVGTNPGSTTATSEFELESRFGGLSPGDFVTGNDPDTVQVIVPEIDPGNALNSLSGQILEIPVTLDALRENPNALEGITVESLGFTEGQTGGDPDAVDSNSGYQLNASSYQLTQEQAQDLRDKLLAILTPGTPTTRYNFDPNQFLSLADKIRLQYQSTY